YPMDIAEAHNLKERRAHLWLEQDNDVGLSYRFVDPNGKETPLVEKPNEGLVTDPWNQTNWIWQKVQISGNKIRGKYWPAHAGEPDTWHLEAEYDGRRGSRYGLRINTGDAHVAYFAASDTGDIVVEPPKAWLHFPMEKAVQTRQFPLVLFTNVGESSDKAFELEVNAAGLDPIQLAFEAYISRGRGALNMLLTTQPDTGDAQKTVLELPRELSEGECTVSIASKDGRISAERTFVIAPAEELYARIATTLAASRGLQKALGGIASESDKAGMLRAIAEAAVHHAERAQRQFQEARTEDASLSLRFAEEVFGELQGFKGEWLWEFLPGYEFPKVEYDPADRRRISENKQDIREFYSMAYQLRFGTPRLEAQSFVMGRKYSVEIPWTVEGAKPDRDFKFSVALKSPLGNRTVASSEAAPGIPTSQWKPGETYLHTVELDVLPEDPSDKFTFLSKPPIWEETHRLVINVMDPETGAYVLLANEPGPQPSMMHMDYVASDIYVALEPVEIREFAPKDSEVLVRRKDTVQIHNVGKANREVEVLCTVTSLTGRIVMQSLNREEIEARGR
ncbi:MAG: hypothetical protein U9Q79_11275, partial [Candidatus Hydrogenedentes bacterium]|nr:hypothetical protein [Candidatus Hydrogenedentota bacterium]